MKKWAKKLEIIVDRSIPYCIFILVVTILAELFFHDAVAPYHLYIVIVDSIILGIFVIDLVFKYLRTRNIPIFLKKYWIEIIAVFPAFLFIRIFEEFVLIANLDETIMLSQESLEIGERAGSKANRIHYFGRFAAPLARIPRLLKAFQFYERPHHFNLKHLKL